MHMTPATPESVGAFLAIVAAVLAALLCGTYTAVLRQRGGDSARARSVTSRFAIGVALWLAATSLPVATGVLAAQPFPRVPLFFALIIATAVAFGLSGTGHRLSTLPLPALIAFHAFRLPLELVLHSWAKQRTIPETMTWTGSNFDIVSGLAALLFAPLAARSPKSAWVWNLLGIALLANVARVAMFSSPLPFAWHVEPPLELALHLPYALIATVCVAGAIAGHTILTRRLLRGRTE